MPTSSSATVVERKKSLNPTSRGRSLDRTDASHPQRDSSTFLTIESALPDSKKLPKRSKSTLSTSALKPAHNPIKFPTCSSDSPTLQTHPDGSIHVTQAQSHKPHDPERLSLDRRGLNCFPIIEGDVKLRLLSLQHNLITNLDGLKAQTFPYLVFLDIYDNQVERMESLHVLENLRVLLVGKNRLRKIEGLLNLRKIEVLDLHGNQIVQVSGLVSLTELKVLNLAGNQIRYIGAGDLQGLVSLQELNLRRNKLRKLLGFAETPGLTKLFVSNNDLQNVSDISNLAKSPALKELSIDNNPVFLESDCVSFLVSFLPQLHKLNGMNITEQVRKAAMAWRRSKELTNSSFMDLTSDVCLNVRREEIISNARTNWELLRSQTKFLTTKFTSNPTKDITHLDSNLITTGFSKTPNVGRKCRRRHNSFDLESSQNTSSSSSSLEFMRLPPILVPIIKKMEQGSETSKESRLSESLSSVGPNCESPVSSLNSDDSSSSSECEPEPEQPTTCLLPEVSMGKREENKFYKSPSVDVSDVETNINAKSLTISKREVQAKIDRRSVKSATANKVNNVGKLHRAVTAKAKYSSPKTQSIIKDREQGGDYLIEICGRYLNVYGQCALRFIDKHWDTSKANDVTSVKFNYVNFNSIAAILNKLKHRFPNIDHFYFKETNIHCLGQLNALSEIQGLHSLAIEPEGNPIAQKSWRSYAIYRLSHWGLSVINGEDITEDEVKNANEQYQSLGDLVLYSLPDAILQPLLLRLRLDVNAEVNMKHWLLNADPALKSVVSKEALQWRKSIHPQEDGNSRQKAKSYMCLVLDELNHSVNKLQLLEQKWPVLLQEFVRNAVLDYTHLDMYMKKKISELK